MTPLPQAPALPAMMDRTTPSPATFGLNKRVSAWMSRRRRPPRTFGFHPSEMARLCPVLHYFAALERERLGSDSPEEAREAFAFWRRLTDANRPDPGLQMEFMLGSAFHDAIKWMLGSIGVLWGVWECPACGSATEPGLMPRTLADDVEGQPMHEPAPCRVCSGRNLAVEVSWAYFETGIEQEEFSRKWGFLGHMDGDLRIPYEGSIVRAALEVKSINSAGFRGQYGEPLPKAAHIQQASLYAWALGIPYICFIYINKDQGREWKEFVVPVAETMIRPSIEKIDVYRRARSEGRPPIEGRCCADPREPRARSCPAAERCFGVRPRDNFWSPGGAR